MHVHPLPETSALYFMSAAECPHVRPHELGVCLKRHVCVFLYTVDLQRCRCLGSPHAVLRHTRVSSLVLFSHLHQTESVVTADLESTPTQGKKRRNHSFADCEEFHMHSLITPRLLNHCAILQLAISFRSQQL